MPLRVRPYARHFPTMMSFLFFQVAYYFFDIILPPFTCVLWLPSNSVNNFSACPAWITNDPRIPHRSTSLIYLTNICGLPHFNEVDENRQKCSKPYRKTADMIRAWCHVFYTLIASSVLYTHSGISRFFWLLGHDLRFKKWKFCHNPLLKILNRFLKIYRNWKRWLSDCQEYYLIFAVKKSKLKPDKQRACWLHSLTRD